MRVLWFTNAFATKYYGYGWVSSLEEKVSPLVTLKVANVRPEDTRSSRIKKLFFGFGAEGSNNRHKKCSTWNNPRVTRRHSL